MDHDITPPEPTLPQEITVRSNPRGTLHALQAANARLHQQPSQTPKALRSALTWALVGALTFLFLRTDRLPAAPGWLALWLLLAVLGLVWAISLWQRRKAYGRMLASHALDFSLRPDTNGIHVISERGETYLHWSALEDVERIGDTVHLHFRGYLVVWFTAESFADHAAFEAFFEQVLALSGASLGAKATAPVTPQPDQGVSGGKALARNLWAGLLFLGLRRSAPARLAPSVGQFVALATVSLLLGLVVDHVEVQGAATFNPWALPGAVFAFALFLLAAWVTGRAEGLDDQGPRVMLGAVALAAIWSLLSILLYAFELLIMWGSAASVWLSFASPLLFFWGMLAMAVALARCLQLLPESRVGALLAILIVVFLPLSISQSQGRAHLWTEDYSANAAENQASRERWAQPVREAVLYAQPRLLDEAIARLQPGTPGKPEVFLLALAGHGEQDVFKREVEAVSGLFEKRFGASGHTLILANNPATMLQYPMATVTGLKRSLEAIGQRMNRDEDVLFLFMTSHGSADAKFDLSLYPYRLDELTPTVLRQALDEAKIRYRVVVVSACYSGSFIPLLASPESLVMTAARADRNSHGCSHAADRTFFGRAYFDEALMQTTSFRRAFDLASASIHKREQAEDLIASEPQIQEGAGIAKALARLESTWASKTAVK